MAPKALADQNSLLLRWDSCLAVVAGVTGSQHEVLLNE